jgi:hypothetical protein
VQTKWGSEVCDTTSVAVIRMLTMVQIETVMMIGRQSRLKKKSMTDCK